MQTHSGREDGFGHGKRLVDYRAKYPAKVAPGIESSKPCEGHYERWKTLILFVFR